MLRDSVEAQCPVCLRVRSLAVRRDRYAEAGYVFEGLCRTCAITLRLHATDDGRGSSCQIVRVRSRGMEANMAGSPTRYPELRRRRIVIRGCPRCGGCLERTEQEESQGTAQAYWHCINCARTCDNATLLATLSLSIRDGAARDVNAA